MQKCSVCGFVLGEDDKTCPACGYDTRSFSKTVKSETPSEDSQEIAEDPSPPKSDSEEKKVLSVYPEKKDRQKKERTLRQNSSFKMALRMKIFLITVLILLLIQGLNSVLEVAFLYNHLEDSSIKKYTTIGAEMKRKLEKSMLFGKPLSRLNYIRLLEGIIPKGINNFLVVDSDGNILYTLAPFVKKSVPFYEAQATQKTDENYEIAIPLKNMGRVVGNIILLVSRDEVQSKISGIIKESLKESLIIFCIVLPLLYLILILEVDRPYKKAVNKIVRALMDRDYEELKEEGIDSENLKNAERMIQYLTSGNWVKMENPEVYKKLRYYLQLNKSLLTHINFEDDPVKAIESLVTWEEFVQNIRETEELLSEKELYDYMRKVWEEMEMEDYDIKDLKAPGETAGESAITPENSAWKKKV